MRPKTIIIERKIMELPNEEVRTLAESIMGTSIEQRDFLIHLRNQFEDRINQVRE